jgi:ADP-ribosylation factor-binding protein GGA
MQQWNYSLMECSKVREAYQMLVRQGVEFPDDVQMPELQVPCGEGYLDISARSMIKRHSPLEEDKKKAKLLEKLLKSKDPNDLMKANKLIKKMVEQDAKKGEKAAGSAAVTKELDIVKTNAKLLTDMLQAHSPGRDAPLAQNEVIQDLFKSCVAMRPKMFKMASSLDEGDDALGDVLAANDELTRVLDLFEQAKEGDARAGGGGAPPAATAPATPAGDSLLDLFAAPAPASAPAPMAMGGGLLDMGGMGGMGSPAQAPPPASMGSNDLLGMFGGSPAPAAAASGGGLDLMGGLTMNPTPASSALDMFGSLGAAPAPAAAAAGPMPPVESVTVPLGTIQSGGVPPTTIYNKNNLQLTFTFGQNPPHPNIAVVVISATNLGGAPISGLSFQAAVPKSLQVKLQPASSTTIQPANSMMGSQPVTQVMLIANATKVPIKIRFKLDFVVGNQPMTDMGECSSFPPM